MNEKLSTLVNAADSPRQEPAHTSPRGGKARLAFLIPWLLLLGFAGLLAAMLGERLLPARTLRVETVVTMRQDADSASQLDAGEKRENSKTVTPENLFEGKMLFQASGWVEPDPYPIMATALIDGVIETVDVLEGDRVSKGQQLASLIDDDARLDLETAKAKLASLEALAASHHLQIATAEAEIASLKKKVIAEKARRDEAEDLAQRLEKASLGSVAERDITQAKLALATRNAEVEAMAATEAELTATLGRHEKMHEDFKARIAEARTEVERRQLALDRTRIHSPVEGRVLRLMAVPGQKKMLGMDDPESATVAVLYEPQKLQARIDVPLAEVARLAIGQAVRIRSELLPDSVFRGRVTRIVGEADLQRNTLQAKVSIENPDERLRPEMLCRAEFLSTPSADAPPEPEKQAPRSAGSRVRVFVPTSALANGESAVWKVDPSGSHLVLQTVTLGQEEREEYRLVSDGLKPGDKVVLDPPADLESGERFRPANEPSPPSKS